MAFWLVAEYRTNWSLFVQLTATYSTVIIERKIVGAVMSLNFYHRLIVGKKGRGESADILGGAVIALAVIYMYELD